LLSFIKTPGYLGTKSADGTKLAWNGGDSLKTLGEDVYTEQPIPGTFDTGFFPPPDSTNQFSR
jgi:hypothetical protein